MTPDEIVKTAQEKLMHLGDVKFQQMKLEQKINALAQEVSKLEQDFEAAKKSEEKQPEKSS